MKEFHQSPHKCQLRLWITDETMKNKKNGTGVYHINALGRSSATAASFTNHADGWRAVSRRHG
jgi:hypothetical protein